MQEEMSWIRPLGVAGRIALSIATAVVLVAILLFMTLRFDFQERLKLDAQEHLENLLARESEALNQELLRVKRLSLALRQLTVNAIDLEALSSQPGPSPQPGLSPQQAMDRFEESLIPQVKDLIEIFDNVSGWILFNSELLPGANTISYTYEQGAFIREPEYDAVGEGYAAEPWWSEAVLRGEYWTKPYYWEPWDADIITYSIPVIKDDKLIGVAGAEFFMKPFQERLRSIKVYDTGFVMLIDTEGEAIYLPEEAEAAALSKWYRDKRKALMSEPSGVDYLGDDALVDQKIIAWRRLDNGWLLIAQPKADEMFATIVRTHKVLTVLLLLTVPIALLLGVLMARTLTKRLKALIHASEHFLENLVPTPQAPQPFMMLPEKGEDDLSLLNRAFNRLQRDVQRSLAALSVSEAKYRTLVEYSEHLIFTLNTEGYFLTTNRAMEDMAGRTKEGLMGIHFTSIFESEALKRFWEEKFVLVCQQKQRIQTETRVMAPDGREHVLLVTLLPIMTYNATTGDSGELSESSRVEPTSRVASIGRVELVMGTASDLTERLNAEREIQRLLERDKAALSRLVSGIAHEMNTPLGNVMVLLSYLEGAVNQSQDTAEALQGMRRSLQRAVDLINHFKALSASQQKGPKMETNLKTLLTVSLSGIEGLGASKDLRIECDEGISITTYPAAVMQVISAMVDNAISHGPVPERGDLEPWLPEGEGMRITVSARLDAAGHEVIIQVKDNGVGMTPSVMEHIFDPFYTTKGGQFHSGLGLSVAYNTVVQVLKGHVIVESTPYPEPGHGTVFEVRIPTV